MRKGITIGVLILTLALGIAGAQAMNNAKAVAAGPGGELTIITGSDESAVRIRSTRFL